MNVALWVVQGLLAFAFIAVGAMKLLAYEKYKAQSEKNGPTGITRGLATFIACSRPIVVGWESRPPFWCRNLFRQKRP